MESWKQRIPMFSDNNDHRKKVQGRSKLNAPCKKHPKHKQSPGVCSLCLSQKLSKISNSPNYASTTSKVVKQRSLSSSASSSYLSSLSSSNASSCSSPVFNYTCHVDVLKKSKSMAFVLRRRKDQEDDQRYNKNVKNIDGSVRKGFWSKLRNKALVRSKTVRENVTSVDGTVTEVH